MEKGNGTEGVGAVLLDLPEKKKDRLIGVKILENERIMIRDGYGFKAEL